jgi:hypothetical protein
MLQDLDETVKKILYDVGKLSRESVDVVFEQPTGEWAATLNKPTINLYLYDIRENLELRNTSEITVERTPDGRARRNFPPRRIDINYLVTVWSKKPEDEHKLLWRILETFLHHGHVKPEDCIGEVRDQPFVIPVRVALPSDAVRNMPDLWGVMENQLKPSINLMLTLALDPKRGIESPMVLSTELRFGGFDSQTPTLHSTDLEIYHVGGRVLDKDKPVGAGVTVRLTDPYREVQTDADGRYVFAALSPGKYDLEVIRDGKKPKTFDLEVPATEANGYDLTV